jgi:hypothetical protein
MLGHTALDFCPNDLKSRMGWFGPTELGERFLPALTFLGPYHARITLAASAGAEDASSRALVPSERKALAREALKYKLSDEAGLALDALHLELRDASGNVIPTQHISVQDTEYLAALVDDENADTELEDFEWDDEVDEYSSGLIELGIDDADEDGDEFVIPDDWKLELDPAWEPSPLPRYQIFVELGEGASIPVSDRWKDDPYVQALVAGHDPFADAGTEGSDDA